MIRSLSMLVGALACAAPLAAQTATGPTLLRVAASSGGVVLSLDSATLARSGESTFWVEAVYQFPADSTLQVAADRQVESQEMDCAQTRIRGRQTTMYLGDSLVPVSTEAAERPTEWQPVAEDELPLFQAICTWLLGSFAASLPVTVEWGSVDGAPELLNRGEVAHALSQAYPRRLRDAGIHGTARVRFQITTEGRVDPATMRVAWASRQEFGVAALQVLQHMRFRPARHHGVPVAVWVMLPFSFATSGRAEPGVGTPGSRTQPTFPPPWDGRGP
ncbi:MAG: energy transducer TonB [Longimicrobiaceae bacterium]